MKNTAPNSPGTFFKEHILPVLLIFVIPGLSAWFFSYAETWMDDIVVEQIQAEIRSDSRISEEEKAHLGEFYRKAPPSKILASNNAELAEVQSMFEPVQLRYGIFRWMKRIAWICLATAVLTFVIVGLSVVFSLRSEAAQYYALRVGWPVLRTSAAIQVLGQGILAVALSFWVTAIFAERYYVKLIFLIGALALVAVVALFKAIFTKVNDRRELEGEVITEAAAPELWGRVRALAQRLNTAPPDQIIVGVDPSFFVTEHPVIVNGQLIEGRLLYLSLPMVKIMEADEADAVLGHELAHFSGQDTLWSRKISPMLSKFSLYMQLLGQGLSFVVALFMHFFWKLYSLSLNRLSRLREFRADEVGAGAVSREAMKRALIKVTSYCEYRFETERAIVEQERVDANLNLPQRLEAGYPAFLSSFAQSGKSVEERIPHPFDTHPTLQNRMAHLGFEAREALRDPAIQEPLTTSWYSEISNAADVEARMWRNQQKALQDFHAEQLAWTILPSDEESLALVRARFPDLEFHSSASESAQLQHDFIRLSEWEAPIYFKDISEAKLNESFGKKKLVLTHRKPNAAKLTSTSLPPEKYKNGSENLLEAFGRYYGRYRTALTHHSGRR